MAQRVTLCACVRVRVRVRVRVWWTRALGAAAVRLRAAGRRAGARGWYVAAAARWPVCAARGAGRPHGPPVYIRRPVFVHSIGRYLVTQSSRLGIPKTVNEKHPWIRTAPFRDDRSAGRPIEGSPPSASAGGATPTAPARAWHMRALLRRPDGGPPFARSHATIRRPWAAAANRGARRPGGTRPRPTRAAPRPRLAGRPRPRHRCSTSCQRRRLVCRGRGCR